MWPKNGKGGKGGSKPNEGGKETPKKARATRTKLKALSAEAAAKALQEAGELDGEPQISSEEQLEAEIFKAAEQASREQQAREEQARTAGPEFLRIPAKSVSMDEQLSDVWKAKLAGGNKAPLGSSGNINVPSAANRVAMEAAEKARMNAQHEAMIGVVDRMFDQFQNLAYEFNQVAAASDLELTWIRPSIARENVGTWHQGAQFISVFSGRISTRYWTLVVRGSYEGVTVHIIPADKLLSFNSNPGGFMAILDMAPYFDGSMMYWSVAEKVMKSADMDLAFRACLDNLVQVAQEDTPPVQPIELFASPADEGIENNIRPKTTEFMAPGPSMLGGDINYSERYKQHFSSDSANFSTGPANHGQSTNTSVNQNSVNPYQSTNTSVNQNSVNYQGTGTSVNQNAVNQKAESSDDWKPIVRQVRQSSGNQPNPLSQAPVNQTPFPAQPAPQQPLQSPPSGIPQFSKPQSSPSTGNDGWRSVPSTNSSSNVGAEPAANAFSQPFRPALPGAPQAPPQQPQQVRQQQQPQLQQPQFQSPSQANASSDDWNFVPLEKNPEGQTPKDPNQLPPVSFPSGLFADMPANLGFSAEASAKLSQVPGTQIPPLPHIAPLVKSQTSEQQQIERSQSQAGTPNPFAAPFAPTSSNQPQSSDPQAAQSWGPVQIPAQAHRSPVQPQVQPAVPPAPPASQDDVKVRPQHLPPQRPQSFPALSRQDAGDPADASAPQPPANAPTHIPAPAPMPSSQAVAPAPKTGFTAGSGSPWSVAPSENSQLTNRGELQGAPSNTQNMIALPPAPLPPSLPASSSGSISVDRIAFSIANQSVPPVPAFDNTVVPDFNVADVLSDALAEEIDDWEAGLSVEPVVDLTLQLDEELAAEQQQVQNEETFDGIDPEALDQDNSSNQPVPLPEVVDDAEIMAGAADVAISEGADELTETVLEVHQEQDLENDDEDIFEIVEAKQQLSLTDADEDADEDPDSDDAQLEGAGTEHSADELSEPESELELESESESESESTSEQETVEQSENDLVQLAEMQEATFESIQQLQDQMASAEPASPSAPAYWRGPLESTTTTSTTTSSASPVMPAFEPISASLGDLAPNIVASSQHSIKSEIGRVISAFDKELEIISSKGSEAFARRDLKGAEHMIKLAETISEYKDALARLKDDYDKDLS